MLVNLRMVKLEDNLGRRFEKLRISLLNSCNFSCVYCVSENFQDISADTLRISTEDQPLTPDEFTKLIEAVHRLTGLKSIRLTGGEPLLYSNLFPLIDHIRKIEISDIRLTTNAYYLKEKAAKLFDAGVKSINISVDAVDQDIFNSISRHPNTARVFSGIEAALKTGMNVKLNAVIMRGKNDSQIIPLLDYAAGLGVKIRFLELIKWAICTIRRTDSSFRKRKCFLSFKQNIQLKVFNVNTLKQRITGVPPMVAPSGLLPMNQRRSATIAIA